MIEVIFLIVLGLVWLIAASIGDVRTREIANWLNFSLIIFALGFRFFYSFFSDGGFGFFYQGLIGLGIFFILGNLLYYGKMFAGGDAKLMYALGPILGFSLNFSENVKIYVLFLFAFLLAGAIYGIGFSVVLSLKNRKAFKKDFLERWKKDSKKTYFIMVIGLVLMIMGFVETLLFLLGMLVFVFPYLYIYAKSVDESCMIKKLKVKELTEGDWLYKDLKVKGKTIKANWDGLTKKDLALLKKTNKLVLIRQGIPFGPVFLIGFLLTLLVWFCKPELWNAFW